MVSGTPSYFSGTQESNSNSFGVLSQPGYQNLVNLGNLRPYPWIFEKIIAFLVKDIYMSLFNFRILEYQ